MLLLLHGDSGCGVGRSDGLMRRRKRSGTWRDDFVPVLSAMLAELGNRLPTEFCSHYRHVYKLGVP